ncbi:MAG TPA: TPM domain-containing protein [Pyrinomonadaceae bacterium]|nr:TPM domain-containing protein [Pyrinomonadaceae bacterium]
MTPSYRLLTRLFTLIPAVGLFLLVSANPFAQSTKLPAPSTHVSDFAGVIDNDTKTRIESLLQKLQEKSKIELYVAIVDSTGTKDVADFSKQLANDWNIGSKSSRSKSLLLVVSVASKTSFTQISPTIARSLPEGIVGEMGYRMSGPLGEGRFTEAVDSGVHVFASALATRIGLKVSDLESAPVASNSPEVANVDASQPMLISAKNVQRSRRVTGDTPKPEPQATPPAEAPRVEPTPTDTPAAEPTPSESPKSDPVATESPKTEPVATESPKVDTATPESTPKTTKSTSKKGSAAKSNTPVTKKTAAELAEQELDEIDEVELTLTKPLPERAVKLKEFLETHPDSKARPRAQELLISTHAALGDQKLKNGDTIGGIEQLLRAIDEADVNISEKLFSGVIAQIPTNLYLRGEHEAAFKAAQNIETKFGTDPKRLLAVAAFYLGIERANDTVRAAESAVKLAPDLAEAHRLLAVGLHISLRLDEAIAEYKRTLELDPSSKVSRGSLADLYRATGKYEEALSLYNEQLTADPKDKAAHAGKVISLLELKRTDEANSALEAAFTAEPTNLPLLAGTAYWFTAHDNHEKAFELARRAIAIEPRYTWAQIALAHAYLGLKSPLDAERAIRFARQFGKFPTLSYELASILASMGFYDEAAESLRESFGLKDDQITTYLAGSRAASDSSFIELLAPERRAGIYQPTPADSDANAKAMKALLALSFAVTPGADGKIDEAAAVTVARAFASGSDSMHAFRKVYAASRLLRNGVGVDAALEMIASARKSTDEALKTPVATMAVQADEFRELRARALTAGDVPDIAPAPAEVLTKIFKGRLEDLEGWGLFNQAKYSDAIPHLKLAAETAPQGTPTWRNALWHLGVALEQSGQKEQALDAYIKSYKAGPPESVHLSIIEQLYRSINGSTNGLDERLGPGEPPVAVAAATPEPTPATPAPAPEATPTPAADTVTKPEITDDALKNVAARLRSTVKITGRMVDANKVGIPNATVVLISPLGSVITATTDNDGIYTFRVAPSQKTYRLIPSKDGYTFTPIDRTLPSLFEDLKDVDFVGSKP